MAYLNGKHYTKQEMLEYMGNIDTIAGVRCIEYKDGFARGLRAYEVTNAALRFTVLIDKCMDIDQFNFNGMPLHFHARPGIMSGTRWYDGPNAPRSIMGGMLFTCGLGNVGPMQILPNGQTQPQHGFIRNTPAEVHGARTYWSGDDLFIEVTGVMRESSLFGTNLVLRRTITTKLGEDFVRVHDQIENESSTGNVPLMLMYHCNVGFPLLSENSSFIIDPVSTGTRDEAAQAGLREESPYVFGKPVVGYAEQVFYHKLKADHHRCTATMINPDIHTALTIGYDNRELPNLIQWKCRDSGNYVTGIEPSNCFPEGVQKEAQNGTLRHLAAGEIIETDLTFSVCSGNDADSFMQR